jgi:hypothetical protein
MFSLISKENFFITIVPGGSLLAYLLFIFNNSLKLSPQLSLWLGNEILTSFVFIALSLILGEIIQTIAHWLDFVTNCYFRFSQPSEIFLFEDNPVINELTRKKLLELLRTNTGKDYSSDFDLDYNKLCPCNKDYNAVKPLAHHAFMTIYKSCASEQVKDTNIRYIYLRSLMALFTILILYTLTKSLVCSEVFWFELICFGVFAIIFSYRVRGCASGLVREVVFDHLRGE